MVVGIERRLQCCQLVKDDAECPEVGLVRVTLTFENLWGKVVGRASNRSRALLTEDLRDPEVSNLHNSSLCQENILALDVPMQNFPIV